MGLYEDWFWSKVDKNNGPLAKDGLGPCWLWEGPRFKRTGYGMVYLPGRKAPTGAHRVAHLIHYGSVPDDQMVCHRCDNPPCVNPAHFFLGDAAANAADAVGKGRYRRGESTRSAKLTEADVVMIRQRWAAGESQVSLATEYGVRQPTISLICLRQTWGHVV